MIRAVLITVSTSRAQNEGGGAEPDLSGERLAALADSIGAEVISRELIADDRELIAQRLLHWSYEGEADLILTSGGTGFAPSDQTPEATLSVIDRAAPGIAEAIRGAAAAHTDHWPLSRGVAGVRGSCLIINLPGSPGSIDESAPVLEPILAHAIDLIQDRPTSH